MRALSLGLLLLLLTVHTAEAECPSGNPSTSCDHGNVDCDSCFAGAWLKPESFPNPDDCCKCPAGKYQPNNNNRGGSSSCTSCPSDSMTASTGSTSAGQCNICNVGYFLDGSSCASCGSGTTESIGSTSAAQCICNVGYFLDGSSCISCGIGTTFAFAHDGECRAGTEINMYEGNGDNTGSTYEAKLQNCFEACRDKKTPLTGSWTGFDAKGFVMSNTGRCHCEDAESTSPEQMSGDTCADRSAEPGCRRYNCDSFKRYDLVPAGSGTTESTGSTSADQCICNVGSFLDGLSCASCGSGETTASTGSTSADQCICNVGYFLDGSSCVSCGSGTTESTGSTSVDQCVCNVGFYAGESSCVSCGSGTTAAVGSLLLEQVRHAQPLNY